LSFFIDPRNAEQVVQSGNSVSIQDSFEFLVFSVRIYDLLNHIDCVSRRHREHLHFVLLLQAMNHFAGVTGDAAVGEEVGRVGEDEVDGGFGDGG
jgi:hypothetical protein